MSSRAFSLVKERRKAAANTRTPPLPYSSASSITIATRSSASRNLKHQHRSSPMLPITPKSTAATTTTNTRSSKRTPVTPAAITTTITPRSNNYDNTGPSTRCNLDKKTVRLMYSKDFSNQINQCRQESIHAAVASPKSKYIHHDDTLKLFVRKQPIFAKQVEQGDFDVVEILDPEPFDDDYDDNVDHSNSNAKAAVIVYKTTMNSDMKTKVVQPFVFSGCITAVFSAQATSELVYETAVRPLVRSVLQSGRKAAPLLLFGQVSHATQNCSYKA
jgi:hypothetical protein